MDDQGCARQTAQTDNSPNRVSACCAYRCWYFAEHLIDGQRRRASEPVAGCRINAPDRYCPGLSLDCVCDRGELPDESEAIDSARGTASDIWTGARHLRARPAFYLERQALLRSEER